MYEDEFKYILEICASFLNENLPNDKVYFFIGSGSNGKSILISLLLAAFNQFGMTVPSQFFSAEPKDIHTATPLFGILKTTRLAVISEPQESQFKSNVLKRMAGMDVIPTRNLFSNFIDKFTIRTKYVVCTNSIPKFTENDNAVWRRIELVAFRRKFVQNPQKHSEAQIDLTLHQRILTDETLAIEFLDLLLTIREKQGSTPIEIPERLVRYKTKQMNEAQALMVWLKEHLVYSKGDIVGFVELMKNFYGGERDVGINDDHYKKDLATIRSYVEELNNELIGTDKSPIIEGQFRKGDKKPRGLKNVRINLNEMSVSQE